MPEDKREVRFVSPLRIEFNSNGRRVRRLITFSERDKLEKMLSENDFWGIDDFCYNIV